MIYHYNIFIVFSFLDINSKLLQSNSLSKSALSVYSSSKLYQQSKT
uniref:Uncharacterized protein n=1 Tax=Anguilla anguilla TaxID=7936 RepID=A0A0E9WSY0_ANGAN